MKFRKKKMDTSTEYKKHETTSKTDIERWAESKDNPFPGLEVEGMFKPTSAQAPKKKKKIKKQWPGR